jgi:hypothetical protein
VARCALRFASISWRQASDVGDPGTVEDVGDAVVGGETGAAPHAVRAAARAQMAPTARVLVRFDVVFTAASF